MLFKGLVIYFIIRRKSRQEHLGKNRLGPGKRRESSLLPYSPLPHSNNLISSNMASFLILITVISMILTPFIVNHIYKLSSYVAKEFYESDVITTN